MAAVRSTVILLVEAQLAAAGVPATGEMHRELAVGSAAR